MKFSLVEPGSILARLPLFAAYFSKGPIILTRRLLILLESNS